MEIKVVKLEIPDGCNIILGQSHFAKTVEDLYEVMVTGVPGVKFGIAFCEASQARKIRYDGNDDELMKVAVSNMENVAAGHSFIIVMRDAYPINVLNAVKMCQEVCRIYCATANPTQVIVAETDQGRGILGVVDGFTPLGVEDENERKERYEIIRKFGYKR